MKRSQLFSLLLLSLFSLSISAQSNPNWEYWTSAKVEIKKGMAGEFEKAAADKTKKYNKK